MQHDDDRAEHVRTAALIALTETLICEHARLVGAELVDDVLVTLLEQWIVELSEVVRAGARLVQ